MHHAYKQQTAALDAMMQDRTVQPLQPLRSRASLYRPCHGPFS
jgi:hypothetical protein